MRVYPSDTKARLISYSKYNKKTGCLEWIGSKDKFGYGRLYIFGSSGRAYRIMLELKLKRTLKWNMESLHGCDNPACISVAKGHVKEGTRSENQKQSFDQKRNLGWGNYHRSVRRGAII